jgi:hypothetical protein
MCSMATWPRCRPWSFHSSSGRLTPCGGHSTRRHPRFHITWQYEPGHTNVADPLSRCTNLLTEVQDHCKHVLAAFTRAQARTAIPCGLDAPPGSDRPATSQLMSTTTQSSISKDKSTLTPVNVVTTVQGPSPVHWTVLSLSS